MTGVATGPVRNLIKSLAASGALELALIPAANATYDCISGGSGPTSSTPGVVRIWVITTMPSGTSPLATQLGDDIRFRPCDLRLDRLRNSEALQQAMHIDATAHSKIGDRLRIEQCALECFNRPDVRLACARAHFHADARARNVGTRRRDELAILDPTYRRDPTH